MVSTVSLALASCHSNSHSPSPHLILSSVNTSLPILPLSFPSLQFPLQSFFFLVFLTSSLGAILPFIYSAFKPKPLNATRESHKILCFDTTVSFSVAFYFDLVSNLHRSCMNSTKRSHSLFIDSQLIVTLFPICFIILSLSLSLCKNIGIYIFSFLSHLRVKLETYPGCYIAIKW